MHFLLLFPVEEVNDNVIPLLNLTKPAESLILENFYEIFMTGVSTVRREATLKFMTSALQFLRLIDQKLSQKFEQFSAAQIENNLMDPRKKLLTVLCILHNG